VKPVQPLLLIDSDAFCKLAIANLLDEALELLGVTKAQCERLPTLPPTLRRGRLRRELGDSIADGLIPVADSIDPMDEPSEDWLNALAGNSAIDVGEAQIYALAAEHGCRVLTGDKRAMAEISKLDRFRIKLDGQIVSIEAVLLGLVELMSETELRARGRLLAEYDKMARSVFSSNESPLVEGLESYLGSLEREVRPMKLWRPRGQGQE
jgi:hypothetical protein